MSKSARRTGAQRVALDANLLILWITGLCDRDKVGADKRTASYGPEQFDQLDALLDRFDEVVVTPNVVTECSNVIGPSRPAPYEKGSPRAQMLKRLIAEDVVLVEEYVESARAVVMDGYSYLGVTDCSLLGLLDDRTILLTDDVNLAYRAFTISPESINFGWIWNDINGRSK